MEIMDSPDLMISLVSLNNRFGELEEILLNKISTATEEQELLQLQLHQAQEEQGLLQLQLHQAQEEQLLQLQLHQVQEELKYYFLENKKLNEFIQESNRFPVLSKNFIKKLFLLLRRSITHPKLISKGINKICAIIRNKLKQN